jgi:hypothetical protein
VLVAVLLQWYGQIFIKRFKKTPFSFDPDLIDNRHQKGLEEWATILDGYRTANHLFPKRDAWAYLIGQTVGVKLDESKSAQFGAALDAAYAYSNAMFQLALTSDYKFKNKTGDWVDWHHPFYLCDPTMHLLTQDAKLKTRCLPSPQASRILLFDDLKRDHQ